MHVLLAVGIVICLFHLFNDFVIMSATKLQKFAKLSKIILSGGTFFWLIAGTTLRFQWSGRVCSGEFNSQSYYLGKQAEFLKRYLISLWIILALASCLGSIAACCMWKKVKDPEYKNLPGY